jgi:hypothetical protein
MCSDFLARASMRTLQKSAQVPAAWAWSCQTTGKIAKRVEFVGFQASMPETSTSIWAKRAVARATLDLVPQPLDQSVIFKLHRQIQRIRRAPVEGCETMDQID